MERILQKIGRIKEHLSTIHEKSKRLTSHIDDEDLVDSLAYKLHKLLNLNVSIRKNLLSI